MTRVITRDSNEQNKCKLENYSRVSQNTILNQLLINLENEYDIGDILKFVLSKIHTTIKILPM